MGFVEKLTNLWNKEKDTQTEAPKWPKGEGPNEYGQLEKTDAVIENQEKLDKLASEGNEIAKQYVPVPAKPNEIQIDYDSSEIPPKFPELLQMLARAVCKPNQSLNYTVYRSMSDNRHVVIECPIDLTDVERIAWQAIFSSDPKREALSMMRVSLGVKHPSILFHRKDGTDILTTGHKVLETPIGRKFR